MSEEVPKAPEGRRQLGIGSFFKPAPPITQQQREEQQEAARKKFQDVVAQQRKEAAERIEEQEKNKRGPSTNIPGHLAEAVLPSLCNGEFCMLLLLSMHAGKPAEAFGQKGFLAPAGMSGIANNNYCEGCGIHAGL